VTEKNVADHYQTNTEACYVPTHIKEEAIYWGHNIFTGVFFYQTV
jgi:hypothetical protein